MKLAITYFVLAVASMKASVYTSASGLRVTSSQESDPAITTNDLSSDNNNGRELLSAWCDPETPVLWHPDYSQPWSTSGCVQVADCDSPGYADQATCCAAQYGGQTGGACSTAAGSAAPTPANPNIGKFYADYSTPWPNAGCKNTLPHPISATTFFTTQLECCKASFGGQTSNACVMGLPNPPTAKPSVAPTTVAPTTKSPTTLAGQGGGWFADYGMAWPNAGCKNTTPLPVYATIFYATQLACCKAAFGGQTSNACVMGLPNPPTAKPSVAPTTVAPTTKSPTTLAGQGGGWYADYGTAWPNAGCKNTTPLPVYATMFYATQLACCKAAFGGQTSNACVMGLPNPPTMKPTPTPTSNPTRSPTASPTSKPTMTPTASPTKSPTMKPTAAPFVWPVSTFLALSPTVPQAQWYYSAMAGGANATLVTLQTEVQGGISNTLTTGAPGSIASALRLYTRPSQGSDRAEVGMHFYDTGLFNGMKFKDMVAGGITFEYSFFKATVNGGNEAAAPAIKVVVYKPPITSPALWTTFVYEPYLNGPNPTKDVWQSKIADTTTGTSTTLIANSGGMGWRQTQVAPYKNSECRSLATWADYLNTTMPDIFKDAIVGQVSIGVGSNNPGVTSYVNSLRIAVGDYDWKWTFGL